MNHLWFGKSLKEAIAAPVVFVDSQGVVKFEPGFDEVRHQTHLSAEITRHAGSASSPLIGPSGCDRGSEGSGTRTRERQEILQRGERRGEGGRLRLRRVGRQEAGRGRRLLTSEGVQRQMETFLS